MHGRLVRYWSSYQWCVSVRNVTAGSIGIPPCGRVADAAALREVPGARGAEYLRTWGVDIDYGTSNNKPPTPPAPDIHLGYAGIADVMVQNTNWYSNVLCLAHSALIGKATLRVESYQPRRCGLLGCAVCLNLKRVKKGWRSEICSCQICYQLAEWLLTISLWYILSSAAIDILIARNAWIGRNAIDFF